MTGTPLIIFARTDSVRLPRKALLPLGKGTVIEQVIARARLVQRGALVLATSDRAIDDKLALIGESAGLVVFRGSSANVVERAVACVKTIGAAAFIRICGDSPFFDASLASKLSDIREREDMDLVTTNFPRSLPRGASIEVIASRAMQTLLESTSDPADLEHITRYMYANPDRFRIHNVASPAGDQSGMTVAIDTPRDLARSRWVVGQISTRPEQTEFNEILRLSREWEAQNPQDFSR